MAWPTWPTACITVGAISVSLVVLNEVAGAPGDPGTGGSIIFFGYPFPHQFRLLALRGTVVHIIAARLSKQWWPVPYE